MKRNVASLLQVRISRQQVFVCWLGRTEARSCPYDIIQYRLGEFGITTTRFAHRNINAVRSKMSFRDGLRTVVSHQEQDAAFGGGVLDHNLHQGADQRFKLDFSR
jgi:hypothetical protein